ncbi:MAG: hypothetical protein VB025_01770 [Sphaerochaeta sp.]|nr:hypothetical protein [Sphaerochaeta sp.]
MNDIEDGYMFWKRVDSVRDQKRSLKEIVLKSGLNYELVKVQRSLNRVPKACDVCKLAKILEVSTEWLVTGDHQKNPTAQESVEFEENVRLARIINKILKNDYRNLREVEEFLHIGL